MTLQDGTTAGSPTAESTTGRPAAPGGPEGLSEAELEAETAQELPDREAMSIVGLPGVGVAGIGMPAPVDLPEADPGDPSILPDRG